MSASSISRRQAAAASWEISVRRPMRMHRGARFSAGELAKNSSLRGCDARKIWQRPRRP